VKSPFLAHPTSFKPTMAAETPFRQAQQAWDYRLGTASAQARNWRLAFFSLSALTTLLGVSLALVISQQRIVPILVGLDKQTGEATVVGPPEQQSRQPGPLEVKYFLAQFIRFVRTVSLDQVVIKQNWLKAYSFLRPEAAGLLNEITQKDVNSPLSKIGKVLVTVQPLSILQIPETSSYQLRWRETVYATHGTKLEEYTMLATFILEMDPPKDEQTLQENPLGIFIRSFQWNREL
jgi:type IV secretory pathway TrbF-like protein